MRYDIRLSELSCSGLLEYLESCAFELFLCNIGIEGTSPCRQGVGDGDGERIFLDGKP